MSDVGEAKQCGIYVAHCSRTGPFEDRSEKKISNSISEAIYTSIPKLAQAGEAGREDCASNNIISSVKFAIKTRENPVLAKPRNQDSISHITLEDSGYTNQGGNKHIRLRQFNHANNSNTDTHCRLIPIFPKEDSSSRGINIVRGLSYIFSIGGWVP